MAIGVTEPVQFRIGQKEKLKLMADKQQLTLSQYLRTVLKQKTKDVSASTLNNEIKHV